MRGDRWLSFARDWLDEGVIERSIEPLVADWQHELSASGVGRARLVVVRGHLALARCVLSCLLRDVRRPLPQGVGTAAWLVAEAFATLGAIIIGVIFEWSTQSRLPFGLMLPANLAIALPLAAVPLIIIVTRRWSVTDRTARWLAVRTAVIMTVLMVPLAGWIVPSTGQQWRASAAGRPVPPGPR